MFLRPGRGQSMPAGMRDTSPRSSHLSHMRTLWRHPTSQMRRLGFNIKTNIETLVYEMPAEKGPLPWRADKALP